MSHWRKLVGLDGIVNLDKPVGWSSAKAVAVVRDCIGGRGRRMGHAGTLDPTASGVLVLLVGRATCLSELLMDAGKEYVATVRLGAVSSTDDAEGEIAVPASQRPGVPASSSAPIPDRRQVEQALARFIGHITQRSPAHSALKIDGKRAYNLARRGRAFNPPTRTVHVQAIDLLDYRWPDIQLRIACGRGTYVRALARDIGQALAVGGYLAGLRRTRVGPFRIEQAIAPAGCQCDNLADWLLPAERAVDHLPAGHRISLDAKQAELVGRGITLDARRIPQAGPLLAQPSPLGGTGSSPAVVSGNAGGQAAQPTPPKGAAIANDRDWQPQPLAAFDAAGRLLAICRLAGIEFHPLHVLRPIFGPQAT